MPDCRHFQKSYLHVWSLLRSFRKHSRLNNRLYCSCMSAQKVCKIWRFYELAREQERRVPTTHIYLTVSSRCDFEAFTSFRNWKKKFLNRFNQREWSSVLNGSNIFSLLFEKKSSTPRKFRLKPRLTQSLRVVRLKPTKSFLQNCWYILRQNQMHAPVRAVNSKLRHKVRLKWFIEFYSNEKTRIVSFMRW